MVVRAELEGGEESRKKKQQKGRKAARYAHEKVASNPIKTKAMDTGGKLGSA